MEKNETQISGFAVVKKAPSPWKIFISKKNLPAYLCRYNLQNGVRKFFLNGSQDIYVLVMLRFWKIALHNKIINKTQSTNDQENSAHRFVDKSCKSWCKISAR